MTRRYRRVPGTLHRDLLDAVVVLPVGAGAAVVLRGGAADVWDAVGGHADDLVGELASTFGVDPGEITGVLDELVAVGVVEACG